MSLDTKGWCGWRTAILLPLLLGLPCAGLAKTKGSNKAGDIDLTSIVRPELVNAPTDPALRFPVMNIAGTVTYGWLDISNSTVSYTEVVPARRANRAFAVSRFGLVNLRFNGTELSFKSPKKLQVITYVPQDEWGKVHMAFGGLKKEVNRESLGTQSIYKTLLNFDRVMALVNPPPPPPAPVVVKPVAPPPKSMAPPSPPAIALSSPAGAGQNQTLDWEESTVVIRGVAMDSTGIPVVMINGSPANMRPQTPQAAEFWSDPLSLQVGNNPIRVVATNSAHVETNLDMTVNYHPKQVEVKPKPPEINPKALDRLEIIGLLQGGVPPAHVADLVKERGIKFSPSADDLSALRAAGATDDLIEVIQKAAPQP